ncbi:helix-turn-helix domain-containing protein [Stenotrophomonas maltophilia]|nr:helix-turn-helix domain-containing protein [Stenotrophomonas maltophilia]
MLFSAKERRVSRSICPFLLSLLDTKGGMPMAKRREQRGMDIGQLPYHPQAGYGLDLEILAFSELRRRAGAEMLELAHRYEFYTLVGVTEGACTHRIDFEFVQCAPNTVLALTPGMAHSFGPPTDWEGWIVAFRPEFAWPTACPGAEKSCRILEGLGSVIRLTAKEMRVVTGCIMQMQDDAGLDDSPESVHALLRHQLHTALTRIRMADERGDGRVKLPRPAGSRFREFERLVEEKHRDWHQVSSYAKAMGCAERTLTRATLDAAGLNPKAFIAARLALEAKRLLTHTELKVLEVAEQLRFSDTPNFIKFFQREVGCTPATFRQRQTQAA